MTRPAGVTQAQWVDLVRRAVEWRRWALRQMPGYTSQPEGFYRRQTYNARQRLLYHIGMITAPEIWESRHDERRRVKLGTEHAVAAADFALEVTR